MIFQGEGQRLLLSERSVTLEWTTGRATRSRNVNTVPIDTIGYLNITLASNPLLVYGALLLGFILPIVIEILFMTTNRDVGVFVAGVGQMADPVGTYRCGTANSTIDLPPCQSRVWVNNCTDKTQPCHAGPGHYEQTYLERLGVQSIEWEWSNVEQFSKVRKRARWGNRCMPAAAAHTCQCNWFWRVWHRSRRTNTASSAAPNSRSP